MYIIIALNEIHNARVYKKLTGSLLKLQVCRFSLFIVYFIHHRRITYEKKIID